MAAKLSWGLLAAGRIAGTFAGGLAHSKTGRALAVGSRSKEKAEKFGDEFDVPRRYGSYEELLADADVQAVYVATPHPMHAEWAIKSAEAGKHILCEKPLTINRAEAMAVIEAARQHDVFLMEAFMYRCHQQTARLLELVRGGAVGEVRLIKASFSFDAGSDPTSRLLANELGGGGILDVGCYATSMARLLAGAAAGKDFAEPLELTGCGHLGETGVDEWAIASLRFPGDIVAQLATGVRLGQTNTVEVYGTDGHIVVPWPWIPSREGGTTKILLHRKGREGPEEIVIETSDYLYAIEADTVAANIDRRQGAPPAMTWDDTLGNMRTLDMWREAVGLTYEAERPENVPTVHRRPLAVRPDCRMPYARLPGLDKDISRVGMGVDNQRGMPHTAVMFDDYFERGGNCFDTAYIYGGGNSERLLGQWIANRGLRDRVVIIDKGAHWPFCTPKDLTRELMESLERLGTDYLDVYFLHRDDPDVPVGEFVDVLNEHKAAGRMHAFGGSNWTLERVQAADEYARAKGLTGFAAVSNNFSLARMVAPPWNGCLSASDASWRQWLRQTQTALVPWSSQARGFFTDRAHPDDRSDAELVRCWYCQDNFRRLARARELAGKRRVETVAIALAYVLAQPFPTFPLIGPRALSETRTSLAALDVQLTPDELAWLNLED